MNRPYKSKSTALLLAIFLGGFGAHHFYLGNTTAGILSLLFFWTAIPALVAIINIIQYLVTSDIKWDAKYNNQ